MDRNDEYMKGYISGQWRALNDVLNMLNTIENKHVCKTSLYKQIHDLRPKKEDK